MKAFVDNRVSVIIPAYNSASTIKRCLTSVEEQSHDDVEIVFVDNNSTDETYSIACSMLENSRHKVKILKESAQGVSFARNKALTSSTGRFVCFLDADDEMYRDAISRRFEFMVQQNVALCYGNYDTISYSGNIQLNKMPERVTETNKYFANWIPNLCGMYDRAAVGTVFQLDIGHEDYAMWLTILESVGMAVNVGGNPLAAYHLNKHSLSANKVIAAKWQYQVLSLQPIGFVERIAYFCCYLFYQMYRRLRATLMN